MMNHKEPLSGPRLLLPAPHSHQRVTACTRHPISSPSNDIQAMPGPFVYTEDDGEHAPIRIQGDVGPPPPKLSAEQGDLYESLTHGLYYFSDEGWVRTSEEDVGNRRHPNSSGHILARNKEGRLGWVGRRALKMREKRGGSQPSPVQGQ